MIKLPEGQETLTVMELAEEFLAATGVTRPVFFRDENGEFHTVKPGITVENSSDLGAIAVISGEYLANEE